METEKAEKKPKKTSMIAKKDFKIFHPTKDKHYERVIKAGEDLADVPEIYIENLKTEGVL